MPSSSQCQPLSAKIRPDCAKENCQKISFRPKLTQIKIKRFPQKIVVLDSSGGILLVLDFQNAVQTEHFLLTFHGSGGKIIGVNAYVCTMEVLKVNRKLYSSAIKKTPFKYPIAKKIAKLMLDGLDREEVYTECFNNNQIEIESMDRRREITNVLYGRLAALDEFLLSQFYNADVSTSKFILAYAIAKTDSLFYDFMMEFYREALLGDKNYLSIDDFDQFFEMKKQTDMIVAKWGEHTLRCMTKGYRNILVDSGLGVRERRNIVVERMMIHPIVEEHITEIGDREFLQVMLGR